ncbi:ferredoxin family protein [Thermodesulfobacteriota bacterium]
MDKKSKKGKISIDGELCKGCYLCISVCPQELIFISKKINQQGYYPAGFKEEDGDRKECTACTLCAMICPDVAIEVYRE